MIRDECHFSVTLKSVHIGRSLDDHCICLTQVLPRLLAESAHLDLPRLQDPYLGGIHPACQYIFFVDIECNVSLNVSCILGPFHAKLLLVDWDVDFRVGVAGTDSGLACCAIPD